VTVTLDPCPACERRHTMKRGLEPGTICCPRCLRDMVSLETGAHGDGCSVPATLKKMRRKGINPYVDP
jgi:hypothetical protein